MYLVKSIELQVRALCMLGKEEWVEFIISVSRYDKLIKHNMNYQLKTISSFLHLDKLCVKHNRTYVSSSSLGLPGVTLGFFSLF